MPSGFFGFGSRAEYARFMLRRGLTVCDVAEALETNVYNLVTSCPTVDFYSYPFFVKGSGGSTAYRWTGYEISQLVEHYPKHGAKWEGWRVFLPNRTKEQITRMASKLGIPYRRRRKGKR